MLPVAKDQPRYLQQGQIVTFSNSRVEVRRYLGSGTFAQVYLVERDGQQFALKVTSRTFEIHCPETKHEIEVYQFLQSFGLSGICQMHDFSITSANFIFILLELFNKSLLEYIKDSKWIQGASLMIIQRALRDLAPAMSGLVRANVRHADIKPKNIGVSLDGHFHLMDFGCATFQDLANDFDVQTLWYRAPEVALRSKLTFAADVWSLGCVLVEMYLGRSAFAGQEGVNYLQLIRVRLGEFPHELIEMAAPECKVWFADGKLKEAEGPIQDYREFAGHKLGDLLRDRPRPIDTPEAREAFIQLVLGMLEYKPRKRMTINQVIDSQFYQMMIEELR
jgi:serine/threonine protein kinase